MGDNRIILNGLRLDYTCKNKRFKTNIDKGFEHFEGNNYKGSATQYPLIEGEYSLFIEHVIEINNNLRNEDFYWFMWYQNKKPVIPLSGVFLGRDLTEIINKMKSI